MLATLFTGTTLLAVAFLIVAQVCLISCTFIIFAIIGEVNRKRPEGEQISYIGWHVTKRRFVRQEYRRLYPEGKLVQRYDFLLWTGLACIVCFGILFGIIRIPS
jgi:hypothetical protein